MEFDFDRIFIEVGLKAAVAILFGGVFFDVAKIFLDSIKFCRKKKIAINSTSLFYFAVKKSKDVNLVCFRLSKID